MVPAGDASAAVCPAAELIFARGTGEAQGPSVLQAGVLKALSAGLPGQQVSQYSVVYPAGQDQNAAPGSADVVRRVTSVSKSCPETKFVLGGYSQGAKVIDIAIGVKQYDRPQGTVLTTRQLARVASIVVFGNPLGTFDRKRLDDAVPAVKNRVLDFCAPQDPACGNGVNWLSHFDYIWNGDQTRAGKFAADRVKAVRSAPVPAAATSTPTNKSWWRIWG